MNWLFLLIAGLCEIAWAIGLKYSDGFSNKIVSFVTVVVMIASFYFLSLSLKNLPIGTTYAIWTGIGIVGTTILGIILFKEPISVIRIICILMILSGIVGLKLITN